MSQIFEIIPKITSPLGVICFVFYIFYLFKRSDDHHKERILETSDYESRAKVIESVFKDHPDIYISPITDPSAAKELAREMLIAKVQRYNKTLNTLLLLIIICGIFWLTSLWINKVDGASVTLETKSFIEINGKIKDNSGKGIKNAFAYLIIKNDTIRSIPRLTGSDGSFAIRVDTQKNFSDYIYFGKDAFLDKKQISSFDHPELVINTDITPPIQPQKKSISIEGINYQLAIRISTQLGLSLSSSGGIRIKFLAIPSELESMGNELYRFNHGSNVQILVGVSECYLVNQEEITSTSTMGISKSMVEKHMNEEVNRIVAKYLTDIVKRIKSCIN